MDKTRTPAQGSLVCSHSFAPSRLHRQLLADAYEQVFPQLHRAPWKSEMRDQIPSDDCQSKTSESTLLPCQGACA
jgi:hypothetical protein